MARQEARKGETETEAEQTGAATEPQFSQQALQNVIVLTASNDKQGKNIITITITINEEQKPPTTPLESSTTRRLLATVDDSPQSVGDARSRSRQCL